MINGDFHSKGLFSAQWPLERGSGTDSGESLLEALWEDTGQPKFSLLCIWGLVIGFNRVRG